MLNWYPKLYVSDAVRSRKNRIISQLDEGKPVTGCVLITFASAAGDMLDIVPAQYLSQEAVYSRLPQVVGIARDRGDAMEQIRIMTEESLRVTGSADLRQFLTRRKAGQI